MSEDESDTSLEGCPICQHKECQRHLLACFDKLGGDGEFGVGILGGALIDATEIPKVLERAELAWVQSVRATGKPKAPPWIGEGDDLAARRRTPSALALHCCSHNERLWNEGEF